MVPWLCGTLDESTLTGRPAVDRNIVLALLHDDATFVGNKRRPLPIWLYIQTDCVANFKEFTRFAFRQAAFALP